MRCIETRRFALLILPAKCVPPLASGHRAGQAMIESLIAIGLICLIFFGAMQISQMFATRVILYHAAARGARAKTVGFNHWMVRKAVYAGTIPISGAMLTPQVDPHDPTIVAAIQASKTGGALIDPWLDVMSGRLVSSSARYQIERALIPEFMGSDNINHARAILNYEAWENNHIQHHISGVPLAPVENPPPFQVTARMNYTRWLPMRNAFFRGDAVPIEGVNTLENHYLVYIDDNYW